MRVCHSTEFAALSFSDNYRRNMDQGQLIGAVFIDLRKAFDTVDHVVLSKYSLSNRTQVVEFQGVVSTPNRHLCWSASRLYPRTTIVYSSHKRFSGSGVRMQYLTKKEASTLLCFVAKHQEAIEHERSVKENTRCSRVFFPTS